MFAGTSNVWKRYLFANPVTFAMDLIKNSPDIKKCAAPKKAVVKKHVKSKGGSQEMAVMVG